MGKADLVFIQVADEIRREGTWQKPSQVRAKWEDGTPAVAKFVSGVKMFFDNKEVPILTQKKVFEKTARLEMYWIWVLKSNKLEDLRKLGVHIWDKWEIKEGKWKGTIGPAYGYQLGKKCRKFPVKNLRWEHLHPEEAEKLKYEVEKNNLEFVVLDQVDFLIQTLLTNPGSRRKITTLWNIEDLDEMALEPCVWKTNWIYEEGKLNLILGVRSNDICVGNPFNVYQYYVLQRMICQVTGMELGYLQLDIDDAHIYDRHFPLLEEQLNQPIYPAPKLWINPEVKNFYMFDMDKDFKLIDYQCGPHIPYELAE